MNLILNIKSEHMPRKNMFCSSYYKNTEAVRVTILIDYSKKVCKVSFDYGKKVGKISFVVKF